MYNVCRAAPEVVPMAEWHVTSAKKIHSLKNRYVVCILTIA